MHTPNGKTILKSTIIAASLICSNAAISAEDGPFFGKKAAGKWMIGPKIANIDPNYAPLNQQGTGIKDSKGVGIILGYEFDKDINEGKPSFEIEYIVGDDENINALSPINYEATVLNAFFAYRSAGSLFYKLKGGLSYVDIDVKLGPLTDNSFEDVALAAGIGIGYKFSEAGLVEIEFSQDFGDADLSILGLNGIFTF